MGAAATMTPAEMHSRVSAALLRANEPMTLAEVVEQSGVARPAVMAALDKLEEAGDVASGEFISGAPGPQYAWASLPADDSSRRSPPGLNSQLVGQFNRFVVEDYTPPSANKPSNAWPTSA